MKIFVTGGSGFIGSWTIRHLVEAGHEVRAMVRSRDRLDRALAPHGSPGIDVVEGDVGDAAAVRKALRGRTGVLNAAGLYSWDGRHAERMRATNVDGMRNVVDAAVEAGCDPVVHVSSTVTLWPMRGPTSIHTPDDPPLGDSPFPYASSKRAAERIAREHQSRGAPVVTTYPGGVFGPQDPGPGEQLFLLKAFLGNQYPYIMPGAHMSAVDVRWAARAHAAMFEPGKGPRRYLMGGHCPTWSGFFDELRTATGRRLPLLLPSPKPVVWATGWMFGTLQKVVPMRLPISHELAMNAYSMQPCDDSPAEALAGPQPALQQTLSDAIRWLAAAGHLKPSLAGKLRTPG